MQSTTKNGFPDGATIYAARFEEGLTYGEMRTHFSVSARSSRFLAECGEYVRSNADLLAKHPEFAAIDGAAALDVQNAEYVATRETIRAERERGVGFAVLADRTGLTVAQVRKIVGEEVGTTTRRAYGARYGRGLRKTDADADEGAGTAEEGAEGAETAPDVPAENVPAENVPAETETAPDADVPAATAPDADVPDVPAENADETAAPAPDADVPAATAPRRRRSRKNDGK